MKSYRVSLLVTLIACVTLLVGVIIATTTYTHVRHAQRTITVTGLAEQEFESDRIVWSAYYTVQGASLAAAYTSIQEHHQLVQQYLADQGIPEQLYSFGSVSISPHFEGHYDASGHYQSIQKGYDLSQTFTLRSETLEQMNLIEQVSTDISALITQGIEIHSSDPRYYYSKLDELKHQMLRNASEDAFNRATEIATGSGAKVGRLRDASMGVFQIVGRDTNEDFQWGGNYNTSSRMKKISVTLKANYTLR